MCVHDLREMEVLCVWGGEKEAWLEWSEQEMKSKW